MSILAPWSWQLGGARDRRVQWQDQGLAAAGRCRIQAQPLPIPCALNQANDRELIHLRLAKKYLSQSMEQIIRVGQIKE
jgi:hypothetical protein